MEYIRITSSKQHIYDDLRRFEKDFPDTTFEIVIRKKKTVAQNNYYNACCQIISSEQGLFLTEFKQTMKIDLGLYEIITIKDKEVVIFKESRDFNKEEWEVVFIYLNKVAAFLDIILPSTKDEIIFKETEQGDKPSGKFNGFKMK